MELYTPVLALALLATGFAVFSVVISAFTGPKRYNRAKLDSYECGIEPTPQPIGGGRIPVKYFITAMLFIIFDIEIIFLYPWAVHFDAMALFGLVESGLLTQRHGAGSFVAERIQRSFSRLTSFTDDLRERGLNPRSEFFERSVGEVTQEEAMALKLSPGSGVIRFHRVRYAGDAPLARSRTSTAPSVDRSPVTAFSATRYERWMRWKPLSRQRDSSVRNGMRTRWAPEVECSRA